MQIDSAMVLDFFIDVLQKNEDRITQINACGADLVWQDGDLVFSIEGLHRCVDLDQSRSLSEFRKILYGSAINQQLANYGASLIIDESHGKIDQNRYRLRKFESG